MAIQDKSMSLTSQPGLLKAKKESVCDAVEAIIHGDTLAVRIPNFINSEIAEYFSKLVIAHPFLDYYKEAPDIGKVGLAYYDTINSIEREKIYFSTSNQSISNSEMYMGQTNSPIMQIYQFLNSNWSSGVNLLKDSHNRRMSAGIYRVFHGGSKGALPHCDRLEWDAPFNRFSSEPIVQIAVNLYLHNSGNGGELSVWDYHPSLKKYNEKRLNNSYGLDQAKLSENKITINPLQGELVFFNARYIHAVGQIPEGNYRSSASLFIVMFKDCEELFIYN